MIFLRYIFKDKMSMMSLDFVFRTSSRHLLRALSGSQDHGLGYEADPIAIL